MRVRLSALVIGLALAACGGDDGETGALIDPDDLDLNDVDSWPDPPERCDPLPIVCPTGTERFRLYAKNAADPERTHRPYEAGPPDDPDYMLFWDYCAPAPPDDPGQSPEFLGYVNVTGLNDSVTRRVHRTDGSWRQVSCSPEIDGPATVCGEAGFQIVDC